MINFFKRIFKKWCEHQWHIEYRSNVIQPDDMGYALRLCIVECKQCGKTEQMWLDSNPQEGDVVLKWEKHVKVKELQNG